MGDQYDLIVLDPPAFAKHRDALRNALQGYRKLNVKAFEKIKPGGYSFHFLVLASRQQRKLPHCRIHRRCHVRPQRTHPAPTDATCRPPGQHLSSGRGIPERTGSICRIKEKAGFVSLLFLNRVNKKQKYAKTACYIT